LRGEVKNSVVTKYYFAGATRLAVRTNGTLSYLLGDHIGSSSVTTDANGVKTASALYKAFGETRFSAGNLGTDYKFTGQREEASLGIYYFNARWMDPSLGRFTSPDTIISGGVQGYDRYAYVNNKPTSNTDPSGHRCISDHDEECQNDDGSTGSGFTGAGSVDRGGASNGGSGRYGATDKCGGAGQRNCQGGLDKMVQKDDTTGKCPGHCAPKASNQPSNPWIECLDDTDCLLAALDLLGSAAFAIVFLVGLTPGFEELEAVAAVIELIDAGISIIEIFRDVQAYNRGEKAGWQTGLAVGIHFVGAIPYAGLVASWFNMSKFIQPGWW
jgi:RHS repeat-associated protein